MAKIEDQHFIILVAHVGLLHLTRNHVEKNDEKIFFLLRKIVEVFARLYAEDFSKLAKNNKFLKENLSDLLLDLTLDLNFLLLFLSEMIHYQREHLHQLLQSNMDIDVARRPVDGLVRQYRMLIGVMKQHKEKSHFNIEYYEEILKRHQDDLNDIYLVSKVKKTKNVWLNSLIDEIEEKRAQTIETLWEESEKSLRKKRNNVPSFASDDEYSSDEESVDGSNDEKVITEPSSIQSLSTNNSLEIIAVKFPDIWDDFVQAETNSTSIWRERYCRMPMNEELYNQLIKAKKGFDQMIILIQQESAKSEYIEFNPQFLDLIDWAKRNIPRIQTLVKKYLDRLQQEYDQLTANVSKEDVYEKNDSVHEIASIANTETGEHDSGLKPITIELPVPIIFQPIIRSVSTGSFFLPASTIEREVNRVGFGRRSPKDEESPKPCHPEVSQIKSLR